MDDWTVTSKTIVEESARDIQRQPSQANQPAISKPSMKIEDTLQYVSLLRENTRLKKELQDL
jgi:hypothetical protein